MTKYLCIHGHFYQPPRENPWLNTIETQQSATPYHDWNERIARECYLPNSAARLLTADGKIRNITNNYATISFNFGATLLSWIKEQQPALLQAIQDADRLSQQRFNGHGNALAQAYNHMIMPLANSADKYTQLYWGIRDFEHFYQRKPEGLWLPETAVDLETLDMMSELGIKFTILAPNQAKHVRRLDSQEAWSTTFSIGTPYRQKLPSGRTITLFFYDGDVAKAVAFDDLLTNGKQFAQRLLNSFPKDYSEHTLMHIATDGETYGHHRPYGDMALAYALEHISQQPDVQLINYAAFLALQPATYEVEIYDVSSWSCPHGVARWQRHCGCNGGKPWQQHWRDPLRAALDWLRDQLIPIFSEQLKHLLPDPWGARNEYIAVINDRCTLDHFFKTQAQRQLTPHEQDIALKWLELQRYAMLMYNSCGWFFDDVSGIETIQVIKYAAYVIQLAHDLTGYDYEPEFLAKLTLAQSNLVEVGNGALIYQQLVKPLMKTVDSALQALVTSDIVQQLTNDYPDINMVASLLQQATTLPHAWDNSVALAANRFLAKQAALLQDNLTNELFLTTLINWVSLLKVLPLDLWPLQNKVYQLLNRQIERVLPNAALVVALARCLNLAV